MKQFSKFATLLASVFSLVFSTSLLASDELSDINNYLEYSPLFSSSGQPTEKQLKSASRAGFKRVVYIAFADNNTTVSNEDRIVKELGMEYVHIPVDFQNPTFEDFENFAAVMNRDNQSRTLLHCQVNFRASAFSFLYRVIYAGVPMAEAKKDMDKIWHPDKVWFRFIENTLKQHDFSPQCEACDWSEHKH